MVYLNIFFMFVSLAVASWVTHWKHSHPKGLSIFINLLAVAVNFIAILSTFSVYQALAILAVGSVPAVAIGILVGKMTR